jgi:hypothetical protein
MTPPPSLPTEWVMRLAVQCDAPQELGPAGTGTRVNFPIVGGTFEGPRLRGAVLPGADFYLQRADDVGVLDARYSLRNDDGAVINVHNRGLLSEEPHDGDAATASSELRVVACHCLPTFEAPEGRHGWLNREVFAGIVAYPEPGRVLIDVYRLLRGA